MGEWKLKGCPRCGGDIFIDRDEENRWNEQCLQCSYIQELKDMVEEHEHSWEKEKELVISRRRHHKNPDSKHR